ncbi:MAG: aminomethyl-transferring glycine dehydrogenase [Planctomycetes bacterium]|nr:aminomethyl-transferring glycine dehydrogenase [Planctomycetota bacterium]
MSLSLSDNLSHPDRFSDRHIGPDKTQQDSMLSFLGLNSIDALIDDTVPTSIREDRELSIPAPIHEQEGLNNLREIAKENQVFRSYLGMGFHNCITPPVIRRNLLENPGWYTQYTPYQAEISQGRLEGLLNFQTMICDLTGMDIANASLLDEASAAAEAVTMALQASKAKADRNTVFVEHTCHPHVIEVIKTRCDPLNIDVVIGNFRNFTVNERVFAVVLQYPATDGGIHDYSEFVDRCHDNGALAVAVCDILSLCLIKPPSEFGADIVVGSCQRFGVPLLYGGPHAAFLATRNAFKRMIPGRIVGVSIDSNNNPALRLAIQTREQHIRREKATSNICTAQALLANIASMYAVYHGPNGLRNIAQRIHTLSCVLACGLEKLGYQTGPKHFFDTVRVDMIDRPAAAIIQIAEQHQINLRTIDSQTIAISFDETVNESDIDELLCIFNDDTAPDFNAASLLAEARSSIDDDMARDIDYLQQDVFNQHHSETEMMRYIRRLERLDISLTNSMIPLGSCTMKLNAAAEMEAVSWPEFANIHPFAPLNQALGYQILFQQLEQWLASITGFDAVSLQPNAGSQGEYAGLLAIKHYQTSRGEGHRNICIIPSSAHGTNPASAIMAGMKVVGIPCDELGNIDIEALRAKSIEHKDNLAAYMVTYPSTHGVFEEGIKEMCEIVHDNGGQVYMDGANMNAQVGLCSPGGIGADVCHLNLHKTFAIPHGGGGPGIGPICVARHLAPFLPKHSVINLGGEQHQGAVAAAPWGSAGVLSISWAYIAMLGDQGLRSATKVAILNANYIAEKLDPYFKVLYRGKTGRVAHECIVDIRQFKDDSGIGVEDVAKRLIDYGFHSPTMSFPVVGTLMIEPTESESQSEMDRFCDAMISIHGEIQAIINGKADRDDNVLINAPHTAAVISSDQWSHPYSRDEAAFPLPWLRNRKFWSPVGRVNNAHGDRNLVCSCEGMENYMEATAQS